MMAFDLAKCSFAPISKQIVSEKGKLSCLRFNQHHPIILIGDDRGNCHVMKLSPNLRPDVVSAFTKTSSTNIKVALTLEELALMSGDLDQNDDDSVSVENKVRRAQEEELRKVMVAAGNS
ncbi:hypothetical protein GEMRC1_005531 [Eukaryota sp. GEM-RC1]